MGKPLRIVFGIGIILLLVFATVYVTTYRHTDDKWDINTEIYVIFTNGDVKQFAEVMLPTIIQPHTLKSKQILRNAFNYTWTRYMVVRNMAIQTENFLGVPGETTSGFFAEFLQYSIQKQCLTSKIPVPMYNITLFMGEVGVVEYDNGTRVMFQLCLPATTQTMNGWDTNPLNPYADARLPILIVFIYPDWQSQTIEILQAGA